MDEGKRALRRFGKRVRQLRKEKQWSQEDLAFELEVDRSYVSGLERGVRNPTLVTLVRIASTLGVSVAILCGEI